MITDEMIPWRIPLVQPRLEANDIHVWGACLDVAPLAFTVLAESLSEEELTRADKFRFRQHRHRYIAGRGLLRKIVSRYLHIEPGLLEFNYTQQGKPELKNTDVGPGIHFNLAHSDEVALIAVTKIGPVGIDVERVREIKDAKDLLAWCCVSTERRLIEKLSPEAMHLAFYNLWTRKEAFLKATGEGITRLLCEVEVSFRPDEPARLIAVSGDSEIAARWCIRSLSPAPGFAAAVAIQAEDIRLRCWRFDPETILEK